MPLYEYRCDDCGETFEVIQKFVDAPLTVHAGCGGAVHRLLSVSALQFKGTGWYVTDYGRGGKTGPANGSANESKNSSAGEKKSEKKAETKSSSTSSSSDKPSPAPSK